MSQSSEIPAFSHAVFMWVMEMLISVSSASYKPAPICATGQMQSMSMVDPFLPKLVLVMVLIVATEKTKANTKDLVISVFLSKSLFPPFACHLEYFFILF